MSRRSRAREIVLQVLYQNELNPDQPDLVRTRFVEARLGHNNKLVAFARSLIEGVRKHRDSLDKELEKNGDELAAFENGGNRQERPSAWCV